MSKHTAQEILDLTNMVIDGFELNFNDSKIKQLSKKEWI